MRVHGVTAIAENITVRSNGGTLSDTDVSREASHALDAAVNVPGTVTATVHTVVLKPASATPISILYVMELIADLLPSGVINVVNGSGAALGRPLVEHDDVGKVAFTGSTATGREIMGYAIKNIIPSTMELGGKSPNVFFDDVARSKDDFYAKAIEGFTTFALNKGAICSCPSRALLQDGLISGGFLEDAIARVNRITVGDPLDMATEMGQQNSLDQVRKISAYLELGPQEGAKVLTGGAVAEMPGDLGGGYFIQPTVFECTNDMRVLLAKHDPKPLGFLA